MCVELLKSVPSDWGEEWVRQCVSDVEPFPCVLLAAVAELMLGFTCTSNHSV